MTQIDWSKAPEGATHYGPAVEGEWLECWHKNVNGEWLGWLADGDTRWSTAGNSNSRIKQFIPRPQEWTGSGLPPVGTVCEVEHCGKWIKCEIIAHFQQESAQVAAFIFSPYSGNPKLKELAYYIADSFRPTRTPEQIAADERLHAVRNALTTIKASRSFPGDVTRQNVMVATVEAMIGAGYRKVEVKP